jgi:aspartate aminotransferase
MIKTRHSGAKYSAIVGIGESLRQRAIEEKREYLLLNRGINAVENIDISELVKNIDFNSNDIQVYPPAVGRKSLRNAINKTFFHNAANTKQIHITNGGVSALDLIFKTIDIEQVVLPSLYWGAYLNVLKINKVAFNFYRDLESLGQNLNALKGKAVLICDPNNPSGAKYDDDILLGAIRRLDEEGIVTIIDSPYRRLFFDWDKDVFYKKLSDFENVIVSESFSKSIGLSGQRLGFVYCKNEEFMHELKTNLLFATNGINNFAQILVEKILTEEKGIQAAKRFRKVTVSEISKNIDYLIEHNLLASNFYKNGKPLGIFVIVNKNPEQLLEYQIGSVPLNYFTQLPEQEASKYSRICVSVSNEKFRRFFDKMI